MNQIEQDVAIEECQQEPNGRVELDQRMVMKHNEEFRPADRKLEDSGNDFPYNVFQKERAEIEKEERDDQLVYLSDEEAEKAFIGFEENARDEEIKRHAKTGNHRVIIKFFEGSTYVCHYYQKDADSFR